jgi:tetratricopeptide (TPR) repeat protein
MKAAKSIFLIIIFLYIIIPFALSDGEARFLYEKAEEKFKSGDYTNAAKYFYDARCADVSLLDAWYGEAFSYFKMGRYEESDEICDQALRLDCPNPSYLDRFAILAGDSSTAFEKSKGMSLVNSGDEKIDSIPLGYIKGMNYYDKAIKINPNSTIAWNQKGLALAELGNYSGSISCFKKMIMINSSQAVAYNNMGASFDNMDNHTQALICYDKAIKLDPLLAEAWYNRAKTLALDLNLIYAARESYKKAIFIDPSLPKEQLIWVYVNIDNKLFKV